MTTTPPTTPDPPVISRYTRRQALEDGLLIDVSAAAAEVGMMAPTAMTSAAHAEYVAWTEDDNRRAPGSGQSERGRLLDVVLLAAATIRAAIRGTRDIPTDPLTFAIRYVPHDGTATPVEGGLKAVIDGGDDGNPTVTIMEPDED